MITTILWVIAFLVVAFGIFWIVLTILGRQGKIDKPSNIAFYVDAYMRGGTNRNRLRLRDPETGRYVEFVKIMQAPSPTFAFWIINR